MATKNESDWSSVVQSYEEMAASRSIKVEIANAAIADGRRKPNAMQFRIFLAAKTGLNVFVQLPIEIDSYFTLSAVVIERVDESVAHCQAVVLTSDNRLCREIHSVLSSFKSNLKMKSIVCSSDSSLKDDIAALKLGVHIVVGTFGRVYDLMSIGAITLTHLKSCFVPKLEHVESNCLNDVLDMLPSSVQLILFSKCASSIPVAIKAIKILPHEIEVTQNADFSFNNIEAKPRSYGGEVPVETLIDVRSTSPNQLSSNTFLNGQLIDMCSNFVAHAAESTNFIENVENDEITFQNPTHEIYKLNKNETEKSITLDTATPVVKNILQEILGIIQSDDEKFGKNEEHPNQMTYHETIWAADVIEDVKKPNGNQDDKSSVRSKSISPLKKKKQKLDRLNYNSIRFYHVVIGRQNSKIDALIWLLKKLSVTSAVVYCTKISGLLLESVMKKAGVNVILGHFKKFKDNLDLFHKSDSVFLVADDVVSKIVSKPDMLTVNFDFPPNERDFLRRLTQKNFALVEVMLTFVTHEEHKVYQETTKRFKLNSKEIKVGEANH